MSTLVLQRKKKQRNSWVYIPLVFFAIVALLPLYYLIITAFKSVEEASQLATMWPRSNELVQNIRFVLSYPDYRVLRMFLNTMFIFALKTAGTVLTCSLAGYAFAMFKFPGKKIIFAVLLATMMIPGEILGIPIYEFMVNTGLKEIAYIPLWIAAWFATDVFMIFLFRQFFQTLPRPLVEAARVDGMSELGIFFKIALPLNAPVIATVVVLYFVGTYNDLYGPALYISQKTNWVMANSISIFENLYRTGSGNYVVPWNYVSVASLIALVPEVLLFAFMQKKFMESVAGTGIKS